MKLESIPVQVTGPATGMVDALLTEVAQLLQRLAQHGEEGVIDVRGLPMSDVDRAQLENRLGRGEVSAKLDVAGVTEVWETAFPGAWWVRHRGANDAIAAEQIAVTQIPAILMSPRDDIRAAASRLTASIARSNAEPGQEEAVDV